MITVTNKLSGELLEFPDSSNDELINAWRMAKEYEELGKRLKDKIKPLIDKQLTSDGVIQSDKGYLFRKYTAQKFTYNKQALRQVFDEDTLDLFMKVDKTAVDKYVKENDLTDAQREELKQGLEPSGAAYTAIKLEKF